VLLQLPALRKPFSILFENTCASIFWRHGQSNTQTDRKVDNLEIWRTYHRTTILEALSGIFLGVAMYVFIFIYSYLYVQNSEILSDQTPKHLRLRKGLFILLARRCWDGWPVINKFPSEQDNVIYHDVSEMSWSCWQAPISQIRSVFLRSTQIFLALMREAGGQYALTNSEDLRKWPEFWSQGWTWTKYIYKYYK
jgi:hypothetical protein